MIQYLGIHGHSDISGFSYFLIAVISGFSSDMNMDNVTAALCKWSHKIRLHITSKSDYSQMKLWNLFQMQIFWCSLEPPHLSGCS